MKQPRALKGIMLLALMAFPPTVFASEGGQYIVDGFTPTAHIAVAYDDCIAKGFIPGLGTYSAISEVRKEWIDNVNQANVPPDMTVEEVRDLDTQVINNE